MSGASFEEMLKKSCEYYQYIGVALIHKIPTPWSVSYDKQSRRVIRAHPEEKSSVDFEGVWHGRSVAFEAKSTRERKRFDLKNIQQHQLDYLMMHQDQGGLSFFLIEFAKIGEVYLVWYDQVQEWWDNMENGGRKSIPYSWIQIHCCIVVPGRAPLDFVRVLEREKVNGISRTEAVE
ncbi:Holliday junction resolvase RecU [Neobacillus niacini]|uniref:Holliday junction resolvase RecU n=1 Tax=Neobacillus niacini TaxID=86668 RepID=UPI002FFDF643